MRRLSQGLCTILLAAAVACTPNNDGCPFYDAEENVHVVYNGPFSDVPEASMRFIGAIGKGYEEMDAFMICVRTDEEGRAMQSRYGIPSGAFAESNHFPGQGDYVD